MATPPEAASFFLDRPWWFAFLLLPGTVVAQLADGAAGGDADAGDAGRRAWTVEPRVSLSETFTDNVLLASSRPRRAYITEIAPAVRIDARSARLTAHVDYEVRELIYAKHIYPSRTQNTLLASGRLEAVEDRLFLDFSGNISRQTVSAFGPQAMSTVTVSGNTAETSVYRLSPYVRGRFGGFAAYELRYAATALHADTNQNNDSLSGQWSGTLTGNTPSAGLSWSLNAASQRVRYGNRQSSESEEVSARLIYQLGEQYQVWISGGREANDYASLDKEGHTTTGGGIDWAPGPRTQIAVSRERRFFGNSDVLSLKHRTPRTAWRFSQTKSVAVTPNQFASVGLGSAYDLMYAQFASQFPDPVARADAVDAFLLATGIPPDTQVTSGFLTQRVSVQKRRELSLALLGSRNSVTLSGAQSETRSLLSGVLGDDFDAFPRIRQSGVDIQWSLQVSPRSTVTWLASSQLTFGNGVMATRTSVRTVQAGFQTRFGRASAFSLSARRTESDSDTASYVENSATATFTHRF